MQTTRPSPPTPEPRARTPTVQRQHPRRTSTAEASPLAPSSQAVKAPETVGRLLQQVQSRLTEVGYVGRRLDGDLFKLVKLDGEVHGELVPRVFKMQKNRLQFLASDSPDQSLLEAVSAEVQKLNAALQAVLDKLSQYGPASGQENRAPPPGVRVRSLLELARFDGCEDRISIVFDHHGFSVSIPETRLWGWLSGMHSSHSALPAGNNDTSKIVDLRLNLPQRTDLYVKSREEGGVRRPSDMCSITRTQRVSLERGHNAPQIRFRFDASSFLITGRHSMLEALVLGMMSGLQGIYADKGQRSVTITVGMAESAKPRQATVLLQDFSFDRGQWDVRKTDNMPWPVPNKPSGRLPFRSVFTSDLWSTNLDLKLSEQVITGLSPAMPSSRPGAPKKLKAKDRKGFRQQGGEQ